MATQHGATTSTIPPTLDVVFAGDGVQLSAQIDYPQSAPPASGYPLLFMLHHAGCENRTGYLHYSKIGLAAGFAVFRWDKRGTGRSGSTGGGDTTADAVSAYRTALDLPSVDPSRVVIIAQGAGSGMLGSAYERFAQHQKPFGVVLLSNFLDENAIQVINAPIQIIMGEHDWNPHAQFAKAAAEAHEAKYQLGTRYFIAPDVDRTLMIPIDETQKQFHPQAAATLQNWLETLCPPLKSN